MSLRTTRAAPLAVCAVVAAVLVESGCASLTRFDPVAAPPAAFRADGVYLVETVSPERIALRCLARGAGVIARACADRHLVTIPNPCRALAPDAAARLLCHEFAHAQGWPPDHSSPASEETIR